MTDLETYFARFRSNVIGIDQCFDTPYGRKKIIYADWTASGRMYKLIEELLSREIAPFVGNTHTETTVTGSSMTRAYQQAKQIIKKHVRARTSDILISSNSGMTGVINKFQRILGLKIHERFRHLVDLPESERPVVLVSHMEHHSNQTSWLETISDVEIIQASEDGLLDLEDLSRLLVKYKNRKTKIAAVTSCSNVTGILTPYHNIARKMHEAGGYCFVDFAASAPYIDIDMRPEDPMEHLDAIYFSPHKFLGGPSSSGALIFDPDLYHNKIPDNSGGGTVDWTNPWGEHKYLDEIEAREDGGTPAFLQTMRVALCIKLKEEMGVRKILKRENELLNRLWNQLIKIPSLHILADQHTNRLGIISFYIIGLHYNLGVQLLNDRFGIQVRGGCSCAGTYGHYLLQVSHEKSKEITDKISRGILSDKPGWIRLSIHPVMTESEIDYMAQAIRELAENHQEWALEYTYIPISNEFRYKDHEFDETSFVNEWFTKSLS